MDSISYKLNTYYKIYEPNKELDTNEEYIMTEQKDKDGNNIFVKKPKNNDNDNDTKHKAVVIVQVGNEYLFVKSTSSRDVYLTKNEENQIILYKKSVVHKGKWGFVKGSITDDELNRNAYQEAANRELLEETGINVHIDSLIFNKNLSITNDGSNTTYMYVYNLILDTKPPIIKQDEEIEKYVWVSNINIIYQGCNRLTKNILDDMRRTFQRPERKKWSG